jgi:signal transduction histidine kinase/CheY-like chemotaxis protein
MDMQETPYKIFSSLFYLNFRDLKLEQIYLNQIYANNKNTLPLFMKVLISYTFIVTAFIGFLNTCEFNQNSGILRHNFTCLFFNFTIILAVYLVFNYFDLQENSNFRNILLFLLFTCYKNNYLFSTSILSVFYNVSIEIVSFHFCLHVIKKFFICYFVLRKFSLNVGIISINFFYQLILLFNLHSLKSVLVYMVVEFLTCILILIFVFICEYNGKLLNYSFYRLEKEKQYNLETLKFFNISYFKIRNYEITNQVKIDELLKNYQGVRSKDISENLSSEDEFKGELNFSNIENLFKYLISLDDLPKDMQTYLQHNFKTFRMKKFIEIMKKSDINLEKENYGKSLLDFRKIGIIKLKNAFQEDSYFQIFLKVKIGPQKTNILKTDKEMIKIEGILHDVTVAFLKKQTQTNSLILSKYIHEIKSPLFLLKQVIKEYKKQNAELYSSLAPFIEDNNRFSKLENEVSESLESSSNSSKDQYTGMLLQEPKNKLKLKKQTLKNFHDLQRNSRHLSIISKNIFQIIDSINNFTKKQNNIMNSNETILEKVNIKSLILSCIDFYKIFIKFNPNKCGIKLLTQFENKIPEFIYTNKTALKATMMNLLSNAMKFTHKGEIKIVCNKNSPFIFEQKSFLEIAVVDTGCGIDTENLKKLCQPFKLTTSDKYGSGLGLSIVNDFLKTLGSKLEINSKKNVGSVFSFKLQYMEESDKKNDLLNSLKKSEVSNLLLSNNSNMNIIKNSNYSDNSSSQLRKNTDSRTTQKFFEQSDIDLIKLQGLIEIKRELFQNGINECKSEKEQLSQGIFQRILDSENKIAVLPRMSFSSKNEIKSESKFVNKRIINYRRPFEEKLYSKTNYTSLKLEDVVKNLEVKHLTSLHILIIDDDPIYIDQLSSQVNKISKEWKVLIKVDIAYDPLESLNKIYEIHKKFNGFYDLILIDENMPYMKGSVFINFLKKELIPNGIHKMPVATISSDALNDNNTVQYKNTFDYFLEKPCKKSEMKNIFKLILKDKNLNVCFFP